MAYGQYANRDRLQGAYFTTGDAPKTERTGRLKRVYQDIHEIAHLWFHSAQSEARNPQGNFYFSEDTIYSYGSHFPMARLVTNKAGEKAVLLTTRSYSMTTQRHMSAVRKAIYRWDSDKLLPAIGWRIFRVVKPDQTIGDQLAGYAERIKDASELTVKPRLRQETRGRHFAALVALVEEANEFAKFAKVRTVFSVPTDLESLKVELAEADKKEKARQKREHIKREAEYRIRTAKQREEYQMALVAWIGGADIRLPFNPDRDKEAYLRVNPVDSTEIQTSMGARFPISHARKAIRFIRLLGARRTPVLDMGNQEIGTHPLFVRNGHSIRLGHYQIDRVDADGTIRAGCHLVTRAEFERISGIIDQLPETPLDQIGTCEFCQQENVQLVAVLIADNDQKICHACATYEGKQGDTIPNVCIDVQSVTTGNEMDETELTTNE